MNYLIDGFSYLGSRDDSKYSHQIRQPQNRQIPG